MARILRMRKIFAVQRAEIAGVFSAWLPTTLPTPGTMDAGSIPDLAIELAKPCDATRLDAACERALRFGCVRYRSVKTILAKGLDHRAAVPLANTYTHAGRFCRDPQTLLH